MQLMTALMIFNIAPLEVSPPHGPTRHFTQSCHGIITITSHHLTPEVSPCHCVRSFANILQTLFLAPSGAQGVAMSDVRPSVCLSRS